MQHFANLDLSNSTLNAVAQLGWTTPTPVQAEAIPRLLEGRDLIAQARTGTGKTGGFGIPIVERALRKADRGVTALVLVPTRELALQVCEEIEALGKGADLRVVPVYGGVGFQPQADALRHGGPTCVVATPGRLLDHLEQRTIRLDGVRLLVLDEADRMLDMGFLPDVERILRALPRERQTALFSATIPDPIQQLCRRFLHDPARVRVEAGPAVTPHAEQFRIDVPQGNKPRALAALLEKEQPARALVFARTKHLARRLADNLAKSGWDAVALQGNMSQSQRERALDAFREGRARVLVATDVAQRGLDVPEISHVINYDVPAEPDAYVHRIGRTGRMGRAGRAFTFVQPDQTAEIRAIERAVGGRLAAYELGALPSTPAPRGAPRPQKREAHKPTRRENQARRREQPRDARRHDGKRGAKREPAKRGDPGWSQGPGDLRATARDPEKGYTVGSDQEGW